MNQWKKFGLIILLTKIIFGTRTNIKSKQEKKSQRGFFCLNYKITQTEIKHIMSFINSIIKVFVGDKSKKMSKFYILNKIKTFETPLMALSHDELRGRTALDRIKQARADKDLKLQHLN
jgi:hypothetical protein